MTPSAPTIHTFDPLLTGKIGLRIDTPASATSVSWYVGGTATGGPYTLIATTYVHTGIDGLNAVLDFTGSPAYWSAKVTDATGTSTISNEVLVTTSTGATAQQDLTAALGQTINVGDQVALYPQPAVVKKVQADGSLA